MSKQRMIQRVEALKPMLIGLADQIHGFAELKFEEHRSAAALAGALEAEGFAVQRGVAGLETAFNARYGEERPRVAYLAEYDALPGIGHGCGHNLIGPASVGAAIALKEEIERGSVSGSVWVVGTPAEEGGGGKVTMVDQGVFDEVDVVMMVHAFNRSVLDYGTIAVASVTVEYFGRESHASAEPHRGRNALDAAIMLFNAVNAMRQQVTPDVRMHGIIAAGGEAPNIIPAYTRCEWLLRAETSEGLADLERRFHACAEGAGLAAGCTTRVEVKMRYKPRVPNPVLLDLYRANFEALGGVLEAPPEVGGRGSSDMGDVSQVVPTIQCYIRIAPDDVAWHTPRVTELAASAAGHDMVVLGAKTLATTGFDVLS
ncbi:MAG TPA: M20 family metallopeptidase, partial [Bacillota bacterium]